MTQRKVKLFMAGYGCVGREFHRIVEAQRATIAQRYGIDLRVVGLARRDRFTLDENGLPLQAEPGAWQTGEVLEALADADADMFLEATPSNLSTGQPALGYVRAALSAGLPVVLANKGPLACAYDDVMEHARVAGVAVRFEATVAACIPTFNAVRHCFAGDTVEQVEGILNGTSNFILTRMAEEEASLPEALAEAQSLGYAETDPSADLDGLDAAAKVAILANALMGRSISIHDVDVQGIRDVSRESISLARSHGHHVKLVATVDRDGTAAVAPRMVKIGHPLDVRGVTNAVSFTTELAGKITHVGAGAGARPTAAAMLSDVMGIAVGGP